MSKSTISTLQPTALEAPTPNYSAIQHMDVFLAWGDKPISKIIGGLTRHDGQIGPSHAFLCRQAGYSTPKGAFPVKVCVIGTQSAVLDNPPIEWIYTPPTVIETTFGGGANGVRTIPLPQLLAEYPAGAVKHYALIPDARARADSKLFYEACGRFDGNAHYSIKDLIRFPLSHTLLERISTDPENAKDFVCSQFVAWVLEFSHITCGVNAEMVMPADILAWADPKRVGGALLQQGVPI